MDQITTARAAGLYEGEGTAFFSPNRNSVTVALVMTDLEPVQRFAEVTGLSLTGPYVRGDNKPYWRADTGSRGKARELLEAFRPWLSPRRIAQLEKAIESVVVHHVRQGESGYGDCGLNPTASQRGYRRHKDKNEIPCDSCKKDYALYMRDLRARLAAATLEA